MPRSVRQTPRAATESTPHGTKRLGGFPETELEPKQLMFTDVILKSANSLLTIINDILDFSKLDAGQLKLDSSPFELEPLIADIAELFSSQAGEKDLEIYARIDPTLPKKWVGDAGRIRQILANLVSNAVKFTENGSVTIDVLALETPDTSAQILRFEVRDTGIGISNSDCQKVFEKFSQIDSSATRRYDGTGLGLSIVTSLVELMGGQIGVKSALDEGSTFWMEIPLPLYSDTSDPERTPEFAGSRVLLIDDNDISCSIIAEQLTHCGAECVAVSSGQEAVALLEAAAAKDVFVDCIILDCHIADREHARIAKYLWARPGKTNIPILILTSAAGNDEVQEAALFGVVGYLSKPVRPSKLLEATASALAQNKAQMKFRDATNIECSHSKDIQNRADINALVTG